LEAPIPELSLGALAALLTALVWSFTAIFFTLASDRVGALSVNRTRLLFAVTLLGSVHWAVYGSPLPDATGIHWFWLGLSGVVGLALGDTFLFQALVDLGPRKAMLVMSSWPIVSALMAFFLLGESLGLRELGGIFLTVSGIAWVVAERGGKDGAEPARRERLGRGTLCGIGGAVCQAAGLVAAKQGLTGGLPALSGTLIRMLAATAAIWAITLVMGGVRENFAKFSDRKALLFTICGSVTGPFIGVWMSLFAVGHAKVAVASALMALVPVLLLPEMRLLFGERISPRAAFGTLASFIGVLVLLWK
jgi:drug/metabolite transporter (DMT)-like permease